MDLLALVVAIICVVIAFLMFGSSKKRKLRWKAIPDQYQSLKEVNLALQKAGLESSDLIIGIDYTKSNEWNGKNSFGGRSLHYMPNDQFVGNVAGAPGGSIFGNQAVMNPYQAVIDMIGRTLEKFDDDSRIPVFGFGDAKTQDHSVFPLSDCKDGLCNGIPEVLKRYAEITPELKLSGPTSFEPLIEKAIEIVSEKGSYHILLIIADGQVNNVRDTSRAIVKASEYPLSIVMVGVGDGPWDEMKKFDDELPARKFDNFQFVEYSQVVKNSENPEVAFAVRALQEVPDQYATIISLDLLGRENLRIS
ncbi:hypothetical protein AAMO2058_000592700 [Amorphochlora amoebiformis]